MATNKKSTAKKTASKKAANKNSAKPRTIKVVEETSAGQVVEITELAANGKAGKKAKAKPEPKEKRLSAIDAAAKLLEGAKEPMGCKELIETMAAKGLWTSPGGKTPHATLYSAILREINEKGKDARFVKTERGRFAAST